MGVCMPYGICAHVIRTEISCAGSNCVFLCISNTRNIEIKQQQIMSEVMKSISCHK